MAQSAVSAVDLLVTFFPRVDTIIASHVKNGTRNQKNCCSEVVDVLVDYLEGRLPAGTRAELDRHLATCSPCVAQLRTYRTTVSLLRSLRDEDLPAELRDTVTAFLQQQTTH